MAANEKRQRFRRTYSFCTRPKFNMSKKYKDTMSKIQCRMLQLFVATALCSNAALAQENAAPSGAVTISGTPAIGQTLTASHNLSDEDGLGTITYQWQIDGTISAWGNNDHGVAGAFAALKNDGSVVTWGNSSYGGDSSAVANDLSSTITVQDSQEFVITVSGNDSQDSRSIQKGAFQLINYIDFGTNPFGFSYQTQPNKIYTVEYSSDLKQWLPLTSVKGTGKSIKFVEQRETSLRQQFYRVKEE